jgi:uncharacterized protein YfaQ (DUF2300 family)
VARIWAKAVVNLLSKLESAPKIRRYERAQPLELLHLDVMKLGPIMHIGHRITGERGHVY